MPAGVVADEPTELGPAFCLLAAPLAIVLAAAALLSLAADDRGVAGGAIVAAVLVGIWAVAGLLIGLRQRTDRQAPIVLAIAVLGGAALLAHAVWLHRLPDGGVASWRTLSWVLAGLACGGLLHLLVGLPSGRLSEPSRRWIVALGYVAAAVAGGLLSRSSSGALDWAWAILVAVYVVGGVALANHRYRRAGPDERRRMQWIGWALAVSAEVVVVVAALEVIADWPPQPWLIVAVVSALLPLSLIAGTDRRLLASVDHLLAHTVALAGLTALVLAAYVVVVIGLGRTPSGTERSLLLASMVAAAVAALLYIPARQRLTALANRLVYGEQFAPDEALRTWGSRLSRAIPLEELLLQLAESLRKTMNLASAEVWTGANGRLELAAGVPHREASSMGIADKERTVVARAGVSGGTWIEVWLPELAAQRDPMLIRVGPVAHGGELLGLIVLERRADGSSFSAEDDRVVVELARQVGLALHNVQLDSALQESLEELQRANEELRGSRLRIVSAGDAERRRLERDLHDGAQQHLVAMAVKLRLAEDLTDEDPGEAASVIGELRADLKDAIAELRALAHGIFPPLLSSGGLTEALPAAASRAALPTTVELEGVGRYRAEIEATVYFCCLEALQNAGKHAGDGATIVVAVHDDARDLRFEVRDDGAGFEIGGSANLGHGFVNMTDRLGAIGGRLDVRSSPGAGTTISGQIPLDA
ncbi:histidine kinase [Aquihabitans sp. McL0605]|uniref:GAF domain-containing sensor histidine kinase n=1 Tax=Aquihabitans sp. McL0605 TaxID=3415671 RepID=UPI003CF6933C